MKGPLLAVSRRSVYLFVGCLNGSSGRKQTFVMALPKSGNGMTALPSEAAIRLVLTKWAASDPMQPFDLGMRISKVAKK